MFPEDGPMVDEDPNLGMSDARETPNTEIWTRRFHEVYEALAPTFGYETRKDTRAFDPESKNGKLMLAVVGQVRAEMLSPLEAEVERLRACLDTIERRLSEGHAPGMPWSNEGMALGIVREERAKVTPAQVQREREEVERKIQDGIL